MELFLELSWQAWATISMVLLLFVALSRNWGPPDFLFLGTTVILALLGIITPAEAFAGFSNTGMLTVAFLFVVVAGLRETGVLTDLGTRVLNTARSEKVVQVRLAAVVLPMSAFLNNTPIVAMFLPVVLDWCRKHEVSPSKLLIPLSYLAILGGTCTLIGTSTNLVVNGLMLQNGLPGMGLFEIAYIGVPYCLVGMAYLLLAGPRLLPERKELLEQLGETRREYLAEMQIQVGCRLIGQTVEAAGLRRLPGLFLIEIDRNGNVITPVGPDDVLQAEDRLVFTGIVSSIIELEKIPGLIPVADGEYEDHPQQQRLRRLCEAVISENSPLIGKTFREADFRATYGAAVLAVHRGGHRVAQKVGDIRIQPGDTLLLQTRPHFLRAHRNDPTFYLISDVEGWTALRHDRAWIARILFVILLVLMSSGYVDTAIASAFVAFLMVACGCISSGDARRSVEWQVLVTIAAAFGVGAALQNTGAASAIAATLVDSTRMWGAYSGLAIIYLLGTVMTAVITNNAAAVLLFPFCLEAARLYQVDSRPFLVALMLSASASFMTPIGYQTNMMVYGPGGYRFNDFLKFGTPLTLLLWGVAVILIPLVWPLTPLP